MWYLTIVIVQSRCIRNRRKIVTSLWRVQNRNIIVGNLYTNFTPNVIYTNCRGRCGRRLKFEKFSQWNKLIRYLKYCTHWFERFCDDNIWVISFFVFIFAPIQPTRCFILFYCRILRDDIRLSLKTKRSHDTREYRIDCGERFIIRTFLLLCSQTR